MSTPFTVKALMLKFAAKLLGLPPPLPELPPRENPPPPPLKLSAGTVPLIVRSFNVSPPAAAATLSIFAMLVTLDEASDAIVPPANGGFLTFLLPPLGGWVEPIDCRKPTPNPVSGAPAAGAY